MSIARWMRAAAAAAAIGLIGALALVPAAARAENNGVGRRPAMGWSSWSFLRHDPTTANVEAQADAMVSSGLARVGYQYVNLDDFWYQCPGPQGPRVDRYGRWVIDTSRFPRQGDENGIQALAAYVHSLGLKFGIYVTPGISKQAVARNTAIQGTPYHADQIATTAAENNYNCGGMVGIDYHKPGARAFIDSWADQFARWGVDYVKLDGVGSFDIPDVKAWSQALRQTGRPIHLELSNSLAIDDAATWEKLSNGWRTTGDIECYCSSTSYPLTDWSNVASRFDAVAAWAPYGGPGAFNDYDSIEVGNGANDGLTPDERQTQMSLWALGASPFILGTDLTHLDPTDLGYLLNRSVISVDQDAIDAHRISDTATAQVFTKTERAGDAVAGLFNTSDSPETITTTAGALGLPAAHDYVIHNLWTHTYNDTLGTITEQVPAHGVALLRVKPMSGPTHVAPLTAVTISGPTQTTGGTSVAEQVTFTNDGSHLVTGTTVTVAVPAGWSVSPSGPLTFGAVAPGQTASATVQVSVPPPATPFTAGTLTATASYTALGRARQTSAETTITATGGPVSAPLRTYSSASDAPATFAQIDDQLGIEGAGADVWQGADDYSAIYQPGAVTSSSTVTVQLTAERDLSGYAKAGIMVRNDIAGAGTTPGA